MAKPQLEDGYTQIANEILERLVRMHLSPNQWQVLLCIIRKTYGFHKKVDYIANFQIGNATGLGKTVVSRCLSGLAEMELIKRKGKFIGFQKDWEKWKGLTFQPALDADLASEPKEPAKMRIVRDDGYIGIWHRAVEPEFQSMATKQGYILEHRLVIARSQGRCLEPWEVVHHKGTKYPLGSLEDKGDNRDDNLELLPSQAAHMPSILAQRRIKELEAKLAELLPSVDDNKKLAVTASTVAKQLTKVSSSEATQKIKDTIQKKPIYIPYPEFANVNKMTEEQHHKLIERFGEERTKDMVENLSLYIASKGDKYKDHYATILSWEKKDRKEASHGTNRRNNRSRGLPRVYRSPGEIYGDKDD